MNELPPGPGSLVMLTVNDVGLPEIPVSQGTAGTIYKCLGAKSRTVTIAGG